MATSFGLKVQACQNYETKPLLQEPDPPKSYRTLNPEFRTETKAKSLFQKHQTWSYTSTPWSRSAQTASWDQILSSTAQPLILNADLRWIASLSAAVLLCRDLQNLATQRLTLKENNFHCPTQRGNQKGLLEHTYQVSVGVQFTVVEFITRQLVLGAGRLVFMFHVQGTGGNISGQADKRLHGGWNAFC